MTPESKLYQLFRSTLPEQCHVQRIENTLERGTPDVNLFMNGVEFWIELKVQNNNTILIRREQHVWAMRRRMAGGTSFILSYLPRDGYFVLHESPWNTAQFSETYQQITNIGKSFESISEVIEYLRTYA